MKCEICTQTTKRNRRFCSLSCSNKARKGEKRIERTRQCKHCLGLFQRVEVSQQFCSRSCAAKYHNPRRARSIKVKAKSLVDKWLEGEWDGTVKTGLSKVIRRFLLEEANYQCIQCQWSGINPTSGKTTLTIDHIDGDSTNNKRENLRVLCPNCHSLTPTYGALNKGNGRKYRYVVEV